MLIQSVHFTFAPEDADKAEAILRELHDASRKEEGVIVFDVARSHEKPNVFVPWEEYRDRAALDVHMATDHCRRLVLNGVRLLLSNGTERSSFLSLAGAGKQASVSNALSEPAFLACWCFAIVLFL